MIANQEITFLLSDIFDFKLHDLATVPDVAALWEKRREDDTTGYDELMNYANDGWELAIITPIIADGNTRQLLFTFKRPLQKD